MNELQRCLQNSPGYTRSVSFFLSGNFQIIQRCINIITAAMETVGLSKRGKDQCSKVFSRPGRSQGLLYKHLCELLIHELSHPLVKISFRCRHVLIFEDGAFSNKNVIIFQENINPEGHLNRSIGSKAMAILVNRGVLPSGGVALGRVCACSLRSSLVFKLQLTETLSQQTGEAL